ncbi:MAG: TetR/AcrR family transcriptional regulator [Pseudomonas sp.]|uniref:TetR/AcrR family transcriptional regulator n=1 Tax=Pseudomonas sp. TaxID=306 RepID=UPI0007312AF8|nr:hypothetical protein AO265_06975 [Pseudomonas sp. ABAC61]
MRTAVIDEHIINELVIALARNPRASLQELASTVRIGKTTLYRYAKTREELIDTLRDRCISAMLEAARSALQDNLPAAQAFSGLVHNHLAHKEACAFLLSYGRSPHTPRAREVDQKLQAYEQLMEAFFIRGQKEGLFKIGLTAIGLSDLFSYAVAGLAESALAGRVASLGLENIATDLLLNGLRA